MRVLRIIRGATLALIAGACLLSYGPTNGTAAEPRMLGADGHVDDRPRIVAFGDSLTAGLGVPTDDAYPAQLQRRLDEAGYQYRVINAGVSGETTAGAVRRIAWILKSNPRIVILELGGNDGLRGLSLRETRANLEQLIQRLQEASVTVVLAGMRLPPNYGAEYASGFEAIYPALAGKYRLSLIPFFLEGVAGSVRLNQADGIHPTGEGYKTVVGNVFRTVRPLLDKPGESRGGAGRTHREPDGDARRALDFTK